jgi:phosphoglycerate dehydrogenase-like enzyme
MRDTDGWDKSRKIIVQDRGVSLAELEERFPDASFVVVSSSREALAHVAEAGAVVGFCRADILSAAPHVTWVQIFSAGAERCLAVEEASRESLVLTNMQKMSSPVIAEHAIAMLFALTRNLPAFIGDMEKGTWNRGANRTESMTTIEGKTMLVIGLGGIGTEIARRGAALGMRVVGTRNSSREGPDFVDYVGLSDEMGDLAKEADVIVNALPLTPQTRGLLGAEFFGAELPRKPFFINVGRGATVDSQALLAALQAGWIAGAGLDVTDPEPLPPGHALWQQENVVITPHVSGRGSDRRRSRLLWLENVRRYLAGDALLNVVDPARGY